MRKDGKCVVILWHPSLIYALGRESAFAKELNNMKSLELKRIDT